VKKETIDIYWSQASFVDEDEPSWYSLYQDPVSIHKQVVSESEIDGDMKTCPAAKNLHQKVYSFNSALEENVKFDDGLHKYYVPKEEYPTGQELNIEEQDKILLSLTRGSDLKNYVNLRYNLSWIFFAEESTKARVTSPWFPPTSPYPGSMLTSAELDIGKWFRPFNLEYLMPKSSEYFNINKGDPLFYLELLTDKKINFKRFTMTKKIKNLAIEFVNSPKRYGERQKLEERYDTAEKASLPKIVLSEIKKNLVE